MLRAVLLVALLSAAAAVVVLSEEPTFEEWKARYGKLYGQDEEPMRRAAWDANLQYVQEHNARLDTTFTVEMNNLADLTDDEYRQLLGTQPSHRAPVSEFVYENVDAAASVDWVAKGAVTDVKNQGQCGSCWAFSTTGAIEGANFIKTGKLVSISEEELVECADDGNHGCNGGLMDLAFNWVAHNGGIDTESDYPYTAPSVKNCSATKEKVKAVDIDSYADVPGNNESALQQAVTMQPVSVAIEADQKAFQLYKGGVMNASCGTQLDHGVLVVGYGVDAGMAYWKVKNSWGATWGEKGYIRMVKDIATPTGQCGIAMQPSYPCYTGTGCPKLPPSPPPAPPPAPPVPPPAAAPEWSNLFGWGYDTSMVVIDTAGPGNDSGSIIESSGYTQGIGQAQGLSSIDDKTGVLYTIATDMRVQPARVYLRGDSTKTGKQVVNITLPFLLEPFVGLGQFVDVDPTTGDVLCVGRDAKTKAHHQFRVDVTTGKVVVGPALTDSMIEVMGGFSALDSVNHIQWVMLALNGSEPHTAIIKMFGLCTKMGKTMHEVNVTGNPAFLVFDEEDKVFYGVGANVNFETKTMNRTIIKLDSKTAPKTGVWNSTVMEVLPPKVFGVLSAVGALDKASRTMYFTTIDSTGTFSSRTNMQTGETEHLRDFAETDGVPAGNLASYDLKTKSLSSSPACTMFVYCPWSLQFWNA